MSGDTTTRAAADANTWRRFAAVYAHLTSHLTRELTRATGLSEADYQVLDALLDAPAGRVRAMQLRYTLQWEKSRLSHQIARMVTRGLVGREACAEDARGADVALTDAGRAAAMTARRAREATIRAIVLETLGPDRLACLSDVATVLDARLREAASTDPACREALAEATDRKPGDVARLDNPLSG